MLSHGHIRSRTTHRGHSVPRTETLSSGRPVKIIIIITRVKSSIFASISTVNLSHINILHLFLLVRLSTDLFEGKTSLLSFSLFTISLLSFSLSYHSSSSLPSLSSPFLSPNLTILSTPHLRPHSTALKITVS